MVVSEQVFSGKWPQSHLPRGDVLCCCNSRALWVESFHPPEPHRGTEAWAVINFFDIGNGEEWLCDTTSQVLLSLWNCY